MMKVLGELYFRDTNLDKAKEVGELLERSGKYVCALKDDILVIMETNEKKKKDKDPFANMKIKDIVIELLENDNCKCQHDVSYISGRNPVSVRETMYKMKREGLIEEYKKDICEYSNLKHAMFRIVKNKDKDIEEPFNINGFDKESIYKYTDILKCMYKLNSLNRILYTHIIGSQCIKYKHFDKDWYGLENALLRLQKEGYVDSMYDNSGKSIWKITEKGYDSI